MFLFAVFTILTVIGSGHIAHADATPTINAVSPSSGYLTGGDTLTISGTNFSSTTKVRLNSTYVTPTLISSTSLTITTPAWDNADTVNVFVEVSANQKSVLMKAFKYRDLPPTITSISPAQGPASGAQTVTVSGSNFTAGSLTADSIYPGAATCGTYSGNAYCLGSGTSGQLGNSASISSSSAVPVSRAGVLNGKSIVAMSDSSNTICVIASDGLLYCWGSGTSGALGNGFSANSNVPVAVTASGAISGKTFSAIEVGTSYACALSTDNNIFCWGLGTSGQLGNGASATSTVPVQVTNTGTLSGKTISSIAVGPASACALTSDEGVYCWGANTNGQGGNGTTTNSPTPVQVTTSGALSGKTIAAISVGSVSSCAIDTDGIGYCWGNNGGRIGNGTTTSAVVGPTQITMNGALNGKTILSITQGANQTCVLASDFQVYCWGLNASGQVGDGTTATKSTPTAVATTNLPAGKNFQYVSANEDDTCALTSENQTYCWGNNANSQLGDGTTTNILMPKAANKILAGAINFSIGGSPATNVIASSASAFTAKTSSHTSGVNDSVVTNYDTQSSTKTSSYTYVAAPSVTSISPSAELISGGDTITITGTGFSSSMTLQVGIVSVPLTYINATTATFIAPAASAAIPKTLTIKDAYGQTSTSPTNLTYTLPAPSVTSVSPSVGPSDGGQQVSITGSNFANAGNGVLIPDVGNSSVCAKFADANYYCRGSNVSGQLGNGTSTSSLTYTPISMTGALAGKTFKKVVLSGGNSHGCGIASDDQAYCWGANASGQLGNGSTGTSLVPVPVVTSGVLAGKTIKDIAVSNAFACAIASDAKVYCWGSNITGRLGNGGTADSSVPVAVTVTGVLAGKSLVAVSLMNQSGCVLASDGTVYCWGYDTNGELGNGTTTSTTTPVAVTMTGALAGKTAISITSGTSHTCVIASDNNEYCWGANSSGQLGDATTTSKSSPVAVSTTGVLNGKTIRKISNEASSSCAIASDYQVYCWGSSFRGALGNGSSANSANSSPLAVDKSGVLANLSISDIASGGSDACVIASDDQLYCWGWNTSGQDGNDGTTSVIASPAKPTIPQLGPSIKFDQSAATAPVLNSATSLSAVTPSHAFGSVPVLVQNYDNQSGSKSAAYTYASPASVSGISPTSGLISGGDTITISGSGFASGMKVTVNGTDVGNVTVINATTATFIIPAGTNPGVSNVDVIDSYGQDTPITGGYTYYLPAPTLQSVSPNSAKQDGQPTVTIKGSGFVSKTGGGTWYGVSFGGTASTSVTYVDANTLTAIAPVHNPGTVDITVGGTYVNPATLATSFTYIASNYSFSNSSLSLDTQEAGQLTIVSKNSSGSLVTSPTDTLVTLNSSSNTGQFARSLTEDNTTRWTYNSVIIPAGQSSATIYYRDSISGSPIITGTVSNVATFSQTETINSPYRFVVSGVTNPIQAGVPSSVTVRVVDRSGNARTDYTGTLHFTSTDSAAKVPSDYQMNASDYGVKTFTNGVTMGTQGSFCVKATDSLDAVITGQQCSITVSAPNSGTIAKLAITTPVQRVPAGSGSAPITIQTQASDGTIIPVSSDTQLYLYSSQASGQFSTDGSNWSSTVPLAVTIPAGSSSVNFFYRDTSSSKSAVISVRDRTSDTGDNTSGDFGWKNTTQSITTGVSPPSIIGVDGASSLLSANKGTYTVTLQDGSGNPVTATSDVTIRIGSNTSTSQFYSTANPQNAQSAPFEVIIPTGSMNATFSFSDTTISSGTNYTVLSLTDGRPTTSTDRLQDATKSIQITYSLPAKLSIVAPSSITAGTVVAATLSLLDNSNASAPATSQVNVSLLDSSSGQYSLTNSPFTPITSITFNQGDASKAIYYRNTKAGNVTLNATGQGLSSANTTSTVTPAAAAKFAVTPNSMSIPINTASSAYTVTAYDQYNNPSTQTAALPLYPYSSTNTAQFASTANATDWSSTAFQIPAGSSSTQIFIKDSAFHSGTNTFTVSDHTPLDSPDVDIINGIASYSVISQVPSSISFVSQPQQIQSGTTSQPIEIRLKNPDGTPALQDGTTRISLSAPGGKIMNDQSQQVSSIVVPQNSSTVTFYYSNTTSGAYTITAQGPNSVQASQSIIVNASDTASLSVDTQTQTVQPGVTSQPVHLSFRDTYGNLAPVASDTTISLSSTCATGTFLSTTTGSSISSIVVPSGSNGIDVSYKDTTPGSCTLTFNSGSLSISQTIRISSYQVDSIQLSSVSPIQAGTTTDAIHISLLKADGSPALQNGSTSVNLDVSDGTYLARKSDMTSVISSITIPAGTASADVYYTGTKAGTFSLRVSMNNNTISAVQPVTVVAGSATKIQYITQPQTVTAGSATSQIEVQLADQYGNTSPTPNGTHINLVSTCNSGSFSLDNSLWQPVSGIDIASSQSTGSFYYKSNDVGPCEIQAQSNSLSSASQIETISSSSYPAKLLVQTSDDTYTNGQAIPVTISVLDQYGNITQAKTAISGSFTSTSTNGSYSPATFVIQPGNSTTSTVYRSTSSGSIVLGATISSDPNISTVSKTISITDGTLSSFVFKGTHSIRAGQPEQMTISALNENGLSIGVANQAVVSLSTSVSSGYFTNQPGDSAQNAIHSVTFSPGDTQKNVYYTQTSAVDSTLSGTTAGFNSFTQQLQIIPGDIASMRFQNQAYTDSNATEIGQAAHYSIQLLDQFGNPATASSNLTFYVNSTGSGTISGNGIVTILSGSNSGSFTYTQQSASTYLITVSDSRAGQGIIPSISQDGEFVNGAASAIAFDSSPVELERGGVSRAVSLTLVDSNGNTAKAGPSGQDVMISRAENEGLVSLSQSGPFLSSVTTRIAANQSSSVVYYRNDDAIIDQRDCENSSSPSRLCTITQTYPHTLTATTTLNNVVETAQKPITMQYGAVTQLAFKTATQTIQATHPSDTYTIEQDNRYGKSVPADAARTVYLTSTNAGTSSFGDFKTNWGVDRINIIPGNSSASFYYQDSKISTPSITASDTLPVNPDVALTNATQAANIVAQTAVRRVANFLVTNISDPQKAGTPSSLVVIARDSDGFIVNNYTGTINFASDDSTAVLPASYTFTSSDRGVHVFTNAVAFKTPGEKAVTATDTQQAITGSQTAITVLGKNTQAVASIQITSPNKVVSAPNTASQNIALELRDASNSPTTAPSGGFPLRLTTTSATGEFATDPAGPWSHTLVTPVSEGLSFTNIYYRDSAPSQATITASDWLNNIDDTSVTNASVEAAIDQLYITGTTHLYSLDAFGNSVLSDRLFAHDSDGTIEGSIQNTYASFLLNGDIPTPSYWQTNWRSGVNILANDSSQTLVGSFDQNITAISAHAGDSDFYSTAKATTESFDQPFSVVSLQNRISVSPWIAKTSITKVTPQAIDLTSLLSEHSIPTVPSLVSYELLDANSTNDSNILQEWGVAAPSSSPVELSSASLSSSQKYKILTKVYDTDGNIIAEDMTPPFTSNMLTTGSTMIDTINPVTIAPSKRNFFSDTKNQVSSPTTTYQTTDSRNVSSDGNAIPVQHTLYTTNTPTPSMAARASSILGLFAIFALVVKDALVNAFYLRKIGNKLVNLNATNTTLIYIPGLIASFVAVLIAAQFAHSHYLSLASLGAMLASLVVYEASKLMLSRRRRVN